jgi:hypothetical protein
MSPYFKLPKHRRGSAVDRFALFCAAISVICVLGAHAIDRLARMGALSGSELPGVDYAATGSIGKGAAASRLDPCGAASR